MVYLAALLTFLSVGSVYAAEMPRAFSFGHLLSPTTQTLKRGSATIGTSVAAVGLTDALTLGVNPFLISTEHGVFLLARGGIVAVPNRLRISLEASYFQYSNRDWGGGAGGYFRFVTGHTLSRVYTFNLNVTYAFTNGGWFAPLLLGEGWGGSHPYDYSRNLTVSSLHEVQIDDSIGFQIEFGLSGIDKLASHYLFGGSILFRPWTNVLLQAGVSAREQSHAYHGFDIWKDFSLYPEIQLQMFL